MRTSPQVKPIKRKKHFGVFARRANVRGKMKAKAVMKCAGIVLGFIITYFIFSCLFPERGQAMGIITKADEQSAEQISHVKKCLTFEPVIKAELAKYKGTPFTTALICGLMAVESSFMQEAVSHVGAVGIMQVTLHALNDYNLYAKKSFPMLSHEMRDVKTNIKLGVWYLHRTYRHTKKYAKSEGVFSSLSAYYWGLTRAIEQQLVHTNYSNKTTSMANYFKKQLPLQKQR